MLIIACIVVEAMLESGRVSAPSTRYDLAPTVHINLLILALVLEWRIQQLLLHLVLVQLCQVVVFS